MHAPTWAGDVMHLCFVPTQKHSSAHIYMLTECLQAVGTAARGLSRPEISCFCMHQQLPGGSSTVCSTVVSTGRVAACVLCTASNKVQLSELLYDDTITILTVGLAVSFRSLGAAYSHGPQI